MLVLTGITAWWSDSPGWGKDCQWSSAKAWCWEGRLAFWGIYGYDSEEMMSKEKPNWILEQTSNILHKSESNFLSWNCDTDYSMKSVNLYSDSHDMHYIIQLTN